MSSSNRLYDPLSSSPSSQKYDHIKVCLVAYSPTNLYDLLLSYWPFLWETAWNTLFIWSMHMYVVSNHRLTDVPLSDSHWPIEWDGMRKGWVNELNSSPLSAAYMCRWTGSAAVQARTCRLFGAKPSHEPMQTYCQSDPWEQTSVKFESKYKTLHLKLSSGLRNGGDFVKADINFNTLAVIFSSLCGLFHISIMLICFVLFIFVSVVQHVSCILMPT